VPQRLISPSRWALEPSVGGRGVVLVAFLLAATLVDRPPPAVTQAQTASAGLLAVIGRQVAWLNLEAPRHRAVSRFPVPANAMEVTALPESSHAVVAVSAPFAGESARGADLMNLDLTTGEATPLLLRAEARESLNSPAWWPDRATLIFERQDLAAQPVGAPGQEVPRYPSRIERVMSDGSGRDVLLSDGRQPSASSDGTRLVFARTTNQGASLLVWSPLDGSVQTIVPEGRFADVAYPHFAPHGDRIAFVAPQSGLNGRPPTLPPFALNDIFRPGVVYAHGIPWDPWIVNADGSGLHRVAETAGDEPSIAWSPDETQLFVFGGTGSSIVEVGTGTVTSLSFVQGYGPIAWLTSNV
jgi:WD40-like Beta Propeller Repeat